MDSKIYLHKVDAIRGIAVLLVLAYHTFLCLFPNFELKTYTENGILQIESLNSFLLNFNPLGQGWIGVELFLVISGFLIHFIYLQNEKIFNWRNFFSKRFWRIYPPYFITLIFFYIHFLDLSETGIMKLFYHIFLIHNLNGDTFFSINPSLWSVALEVQLYLIYPIFLILVKRLSIIKTTLILLVITVILCFISYKFNIIGLISGSLVLTFWFTWASGALLAYKFYNNQRLFKKPIIWFFIFYLLFFIFKISLVSNFFIIIPATLACLAFMETILYCSIFDKNYFQLIFKKISFIGLISYSLYLIHQPFLVNLLDFYNPNSSFKFINIIFQVAFTYITVFLISYALYNLIEKRSVNFGKLLREKNTFLIQKK